MVVTDEDLVSYEHITTALGQLKHKNTRKRATW